MLKKFFSYYKPYKNLFLIDFGAAIIAGVLELIFPIAVNRVIDQVLPNGNLKTILMVSVTLFALYMLSMHVGEEHAGAVYIELTGNNESEIEIDENGNGQFEVNLMQGFKMH